MVYFLHIYYTANNSPFSFILLNTRCTTISNNIFYSILFYYNFVVTIFWLDLEVHTGLQLHRIALCKGIQQIFACGIRNWKMFTRGIQPTNDWNPESKFQWKRRESSTWNRESTARDPESKASGLTDMWQIEQISREKKNIIQLLTPLVDHGV